MKPDLHKKYCEQNGKMQAWYKARAEQLDLPIYSSYDIRDSGFKVTNVDGNIYPAGFNNICPTDKDLAIEIFSDFIRAHYGPQVQKILLVTEAHTGNPYYWTMFLRSNLCLNPVQKKF
jgi:glutamate--cysteine ligase